ncbi:lipopolysaccharide biosynthesis protein [Methyloversatilis sp.]|uniref:lipopolysaccharide biosynthesis protein n=1 Tax=Methyloversatilis sp. TaxID=2569862 RepID=UPI0027B9889D|nr:lipopolysaccharide biosynthesis protein [Methyloversatilis sp.]
MTIRSALLYSFTTRYASLVIQFVASVIIARLLSPTELGIYSVGAAVIMIAHTFRDFGTSAYVIQESELTEDRLRTAFTLTIMVAWVIAAILYSASGPLASFYDEPGVGEVLRVMSANFALIPFGSITLALLRREMNFRSIMFINLASTFVHSGASILFAVLGLGFISLAWAAVLGTATTVIGALMVNRSWVMAWPSLSERRHVLGFSVRSSVSSIASEAGHASPDIILGRVLGMEATGMFGRAMGYVQLFERLLQDVLRSVMLPYLSDEIRSGSNLRATLNRALENIASVSWFLIGLTAVLAEPGIRILFGSQWGEAAPIAQVLAVSMAIRCISPSLASGLVANGQIDLLMKVSVLSVGTKLLLLILLSPYGLFWASVGFSLSEALTLVIMLHTTHRKGMFTWGDYARVSARTLPPALVGLVPAVLVVASDIATDTFLERIALILCAGLSSLVLWLVVLWLFDIPPKHELQRLLDKILRRKRVTKAGDL